MMIITFSRAMTLKLNFVVVQFGSKTISRRDERVFHKRERSRFFGRFFSLFRCQKILTQTLRENDTRENNHPRTTENEEDDDNRDDATTTRNDAKTNDGRGEYHPVGRGRFGTTGDE